MKKEDHFYIVVRRDLDPGLQAAQAVHAARAFVHEWPEIELHWFKTSNNVVLLSAKDEEHLAELVRKAKDRGFATSTFHEEDLGNQLTAAAFAPTAWRFLSSLPRMLKEHRACKQAA